MTPGISVAVTMLAVAVIVSFFRLLQGPTLADRVICIDLIGVIIVGIAVVAAAATGEQAFLDAALVLALISFVGTIAYARYIEGEGQS